MRERSSRWEGWGCAFVLVVLVAALSARAVTSWNAMLVELRRRPRPSPAAPPTLAQHETPVPAGRVALGAYLPEAPSDGLASVQRFEALVGHKLRYILWFQSWGDAERDFPMAWVQQAAREGLTPVITWEPWKRDFEHPAADQPAYSLAGIGAGRHDEYIRSWARAARATRAPIVIRFAHEQSTSPGEKSWYPWQGDPEGYRAAFRRIVTLFREEGARNVRFLWSAMWLDRPWVGSYFPGDDVVDLIGTTVLNHGTAPKLSWSEWRSFEQLFEVQYQAALRWRKPIIITELATAEEGGDKAAWLRDCLGALKRRYPQVHGILLLEMPQDREWPDINWSVASSPRVLDAFREGIRDPYFE